MKYQKILVALDRCPEAEVVFEQALELAKIEQSSMMLFHCLPIDTQTVGSYGDIFGRELLEFTKLMQDKLRKESEEALAWLSSYCEKATAAGVPTEWDCKVGDAGTAIRELSHSWGADLVVIGRRGRRGITEIIMGSVSNYVVHHVPCSVLIVQGIIPQAHDIPTAAT
ncbi:MAG TPA: universal stress protein [Cyanobacteria bacterium UBA11149]|nr:universal stress protein [Cyanobacteria bacterium UBA11367]HBE57032.1 universal stress protein [Cyanobacteria bacterium UBA11366]HBK66761.1 universal stress protein [Cyanobacteria bacterium UBA11166]HBR73037.1 universal stress protein [Cyanobacteria bacterium UBA11159]HBS72747.1 universal stress protein [Cyanobacteria bacterium UBA11153]HBW88870.1 universal stress protein [Cyanobacteria bacterium UBA11149]HCA97033.1 universal stress protein [Cyanobacteria bacterium UBA9226]